MSHGGSDKCEPNFTPLLDLVLQLVMFFMLCANFVMDQTNVEIKLPSAIAAKALESTVDYAIYLNVNEQGKVILTASDQFTDTEGKVTDTLDNAEQVRIFLVRRAKEDLAAAGPAGKDKPPRSVIVLRVHKECSFEKTYAIMKACRQAGYLKVQLRAIRHSGAE
ncbi:MAG: biopolymer transporter ExbD [Planctomycetes bacterium]|nr:biopolymer transporter ExbD [Planctomycetota bacterium]